MTDQQPTVTESPGSVPPENEARTIRWCAGHWAELVKALEARGLQDQISYDEEELSAKFLRNEIDPLWEACQMVNSGALELFGADRIFDENNGCTVCAFANILQHVADVITTSRGSAH